MLQPITVLYSTKTAFDLGSHSTRQKYLNLWTCMGSNGDSSWVKEKMFIVYSADIIHVGTVAVYISLLTVIISFYL